MSNYLKRLRAHPGVAVAAIDAAIKEQ